WEEADSFPAPLPVLQRTARAEGRVMLADALDASVALQSAVEIVPVPGDFPWQASHDETVAIEAELVPERMEGLTGRLRLEVARKVRATRAMHDASFGRIEPIVYGDVVSRTLMPDGWD